MSYPVGTICIGQGFVLSSSVHRNGMECVVIGPLEYRKGIWRGTKEPCQRFSYRCQWADGTITCVAHKNLKPKDWYDEDKRAEDRQKVSKLISDCLKAIEAGEKV